MFISTPQTEFELHRLHIAYDRIQHMRKRRIYLGVLCTRKNFVKNFAKFTGKHLCWSHFLIKLQAFYSIPPDNCFWNTWNSPGKMVPAIVRFFESIFSGRWKFFRHYNSESTRHLASRNHFTRDAKWFKGTIMQIWKSPYTLLFI